MPPPESESLQWLQQWYRGQCDGVWEHQNGVEIGTLDNPGWRLEVDLADTELAGSVQERVVVSRNDDDWLQWWVEEDRFHAAGGALNLTEMLLAFRDFAAGAHA